VYQNSVLSSDPYEYFSHKEYILGISADMASPTLGPAMKKFGEQVMLASGQIFLNNLLSCGQAKVVDHSLFFYLSKVALSFCQWHANIYESLHS
jgi:hypothetical protein